MDSPYDVLGVAADATDGEIKAAYKRRVKEAHPDHGGTMEEFQLVKAAYEDIKAGTAHRTQDIQHEQETVETPEPDVPKTFTVQYLNFETFDDHGWELTDEELFSEAEDAALDREDFGELIVQPGESLLEAAERYGFTWPYACRGGACANCAVAVIEGDILQPVDHILPDEMIDRGIRLSCLGQPTETDMKVVFNIKALPDLEELRLPPGPFSKVQADD
ncbi:2Fe-2S iron-sulfur cluster binding domain-containing protein [Halorubraceae archaeon YAN]|nr:2Fe-2S iron-sulfur cluster binding domain-containing protein [Halorubraceae archaeon YAN]